MALFSLKLLQGSLKDSGPQIGLQLALAGIFVGSVGGFLNFGADFIPSIDIKPATFFSAAGVFQAPSTETSLDFVILTFCSVLLAFGLPLLTPIAASFLVFICALPALYLNISDPYRDSIIPMQYSLLVILMLFGMNVLISYFLETQRKQKLIGAFGKFVPPAIASELSKHSGDINLDGESKELTVFFCDLQNFTGISEKLSPRKLVSLLNEYFTLMTSILHDHGATIDKYIGDSIMAFWGAPLPQTDHAKRAILASFEMQKAIKELSKDLTKRGLPELRMGIGINTGMMNVGNMGSNYRLAYTVVGDSVNLAARLEALTRHYHSPIIIGEKTKNQIDDVLFKELDTVTVKGKNELSRIYSPICLEEEASPELEKMITQHQLALESYYSGHVDSAREDFKKLTHTAPDDANYYQYMLDKMN